MLTSLIALGVCASQAPVPAQTSGGTPYQPGKSGAVGVSLNAVNILRAGESEGDEPYILVYQYGVEIPVLKGDALGSPKELPLLMVGAGGFSSLHGGSNWAKPNDEQKIRGFSTHFFRKPNAYILFGFRTFVFEHDGFNEAQLLQMKRVATSIVRQAQDLALKSDPKTLIDPTQFPAVMLPGKFSVLNMQKIQEMATGRADNIVGEHTLILLSKPLGTGPGVPEDLVRQGPKPTTYRPNSNSQFSFELEPHSGFQADWIYRGILRMKGNISRHL